VLGDSHPYTITMLKMLTDMLRQKGKLADAEKYLRAAYEGVRRKEGDDHSETITLAGSLGAVLRDQGKLDEAEKYFQLSLDANRRRYGLDNANTITAIMRIASLRQAQGRNADVVALLTPIQEKVKTVISGLVGTLRYASTRGLLGKAHTGLAKSAADFKAAEGELLEAHATFLKHRGERDKETIDWVDGLVDLYTAWNKAEPGKAYDAKAAEWRSKRPPFRTSKQPAEKKL